MDEHPSQGLASELGREGKLDKTTEASPIALLYTYTASSDKNGWNDSTKSRGRTPHLMTGEVAATSAPHACLVSSAPMQPTAKRMAPAPAPPGGGELQCNCRPEAQPASPCWPLGWPASP